MSYPNDLKEYPQLEEKTYPFRLFFNECKNAKIGQNILYLHWHEHFEIIIMQEGSAIFHIDSKPYELHVGEVLFVPSGGLHVGYSLRDDHVRFISVVFHSSLFKDWKQDPQHEQFVIPYLENRYQLPVKPAELVPTCSTYFSLLDTIVDEVLQKGPAFNWSSRINCIYSLCCSLAPFYLNKYPVERMSGTPLIANVLSHY